MQADAATSTEFRIDPVEALMLPEAATAMLDRLATLLTMLSEATDDAEWRTELLDELKEVQFVSQTLSKHLARLLILAAANGPTPNIRH